MTKRDGVTLFEVKKLSVGYGAKRVLTDVDFTVKSGQFVAFLGPNGAGKSTLLKTLARLLKPISGTVLVEGMDVELYRSGELAKRLSVVLTGHHTRTMFSVEEFVSLGRYPYTNFIGALSDVDRKEVKRALRLVSAEHLAERSVSTLSDGERQKVVLARALAQRPSVLLLDEPTVHLDLKHKVEILSILRNLCCEENLCVIAALHDVDVAFKVSDVVALVKDGVIKEWGSPEEIIKDTTPASLYGFDSARFNPLLGTVDWRMPKNGKPVFVVAGMGTGAILFRLLGKKGYRLATGVVHRNDIDFHVASAMEVECVSCEPLEDISFELYQKALRWASEVYCVIDAGFPVKPLNQMNVRLISRCINGGKRVLSLRSPEEAYSLFGASDGLVCCEDVHRLLEYLNSDGKGVVVSSLKRASQ